MKKIKPSPDERQPSVTNNVETTAQETQSKYFKPFHRCKTDCCIVGDGQLGRLLL